MWFVPIIIIIRIRILCWVQYELLCVDHTHSLIHQFCCSPPITSAHCWLLPACLSLPGPAEELFPPPSSHPAATGIVHHCPSSQQHISSDWVVDGGWCEEEEKDQMGWITRSERVSLTVMWESHYKYWIKIIICLHLYPLMWNVMWVAQKSHVTIAPLVMMSQRIVV